MIDTTTTQLTSPSAEGPRSRHIARHRVAGSRLTVAAQARSCSGAAGANYDLLASSDVALT